LKEKKEKEAAEFAKKKEAFKAGKSLGVSSKLQYDKQAFCCVTG